MASNPPQKVRIVGKIRAFANQESGAVDSATKTWISVHRTDGNSSGRVKISFEEQSAGGKRCYEVDECYEQDAGNDLIFRTEIKPLISSLFEGRNATIFAYGSKGSGKTYTIQGSENDTGVAAMAMAEILSCAEEVGSSVSISLYEVYQEHVFDLLDSRSPEVSVFEDAQGKVRLKGLSKVNVKSMSEFMNLYCNGVNLRKALQKTANEQPRCSNKGLIIHVLLSRNESSGSSHWGKMNFVDLAGYENSRRKSIHDSSVIEINRTNKSLYAIQNVIYALKVGESHVPYRECKLTRMLQDCLGGTNRILMVTCMNPSFCEDTIKTLSLASRSCQAINRANANPTRRGKNSTTMMSSSKAGKPVTYSGSTKVQDKSLLHSSEKKYSGGVALTGMSQHGCGVGISIGNIRPLLEEANETKSSEQGNSISNVLSEALSSQTTVEQMSDTTQALQRSVNIPQAKRHVTATAVSFHESTTEKNNLSSDESGSPPLSARLREISNNLKSLYTSSQSKLKMTQENETSEPMTPILQRGLRANDKCDIANVVSPWEKFQVHSSGMKDSFVEEYLKFLNTASKEELKGLKGIGEKRATYILQLREESPEPFKNLDDLKDVGLSSKQIKGMMKKIAGDMF
ncbi:hypothetical protein Nepgr_029963 [Nepenthes gracilis]|uniref:Kinesin motor domain-containing protein n=1 Tax=Nepenthes gracilis TaxID=150966 RepID=A0AAD3TEJ3_NEPGR|nr:hypothetical protein Nepgr_029963 [Nepenthes gracilis]